MYEKEIGEIKEKTQSLISANKDLQKEYQKLHNSHFTNKQFCDELQNITQSNDPKEIVNIIQNMKTSSDLLNKISSIIEIPIKDLSEKILHYKEAFQDLKELHQIFPSNSTNELIEQIKVIRNENTKLLNQQKRISHLLSLEPNVDISKTINDLVDKQSKLSEELNNAANFVSEILTIISGPTRLVFPLKSTQKEKIIEVVIRIKKKMDLEHNIVDKIIESAKQKGYYGDSGEEAISFLFNQTSNLENSFNNSNNIDLNNSKLKKQIIILKESLSQQMEQSTKREEKLLSDIKVLNDELKSHRRIREELKNLSEGKEIDKSFLKSNLSKSEYSLLDTVNKN